MGVDICQDIKSGTLRPKRPAQINKERSAPTDMREGGCGQTLGTRRAVYNLVFCFIFFVDLFRHNGIHPGWEAQLVEPEETESELQQQRDIYTATRAPGDANLVCQE